MKKIFGLAISAILVIALAVGGTLAYFNDTETSTGNVFTAGTIDLEVNNENPWTTTLWATSEDWKPDQTAAVAQITLENVGTNPMDVWMKITKTGTTTGALNYPVGAAVASSEPEYLAEGGPGSFSAIDDIDTQILYELTVGTTDVITYTDALFISAIDTYYIWIGNIDAAETLTVDQNFKLDAAAGNEYQGDDITFTIEFFAQQSEGDTTPAAPATELTDYGRPVAP
ncbi:MAG: TasA family protein [Dehalococcoidales bacterium]|nr:TasA family protein [Dehalococcoidales bacterium]